MARMKSCFSGDMDAWAHAHAARGSAAMSFEPADAVQAVQLARLTQTDSMLVVALFMCCQLPARQILLGGGQAGRLAAEDAAACVDGRMRLLNDGIAATYRVFNAGRSPLCADAKHCVRFPRAVLASRIDVDRACDGALMPVLDGWDELVDGALVDGKLCKACGLHYKRKGLQERRAFWRRLPRYMGVQASVWVSFDWEGDDDK
ncbi:uncharacterized protein FIBRA_03128 [Fibroporia radiculosa]|uniref:Uncharacterized protein n=1 Tax=Fibroporia radiculosa TaxID=599839 RepID=J4GNB1_9APHY|nr:uncharacterized protein FIBRA_03128 [Fibroporia radiculosa]CCM01080.1 predicted protein [Fibroporia radiculosa]